MIGLFRAEMGWVFPSYSSHGSDFNYDYHVTTDGSVAPEEYNYRPPPPGGERPMELPGTSCFLRDGTCHRGPAVTAGEATG